MRTSICKNPCLRIDETHSLIWGKSKNKTRCYLFNPVTEVIEAQGVGVRKPTDIYDFAFGMKQSLISLFRNYKYERPFRKLCFDIFYEAYGQGVCEPIPKSATKEKECGGMKWGVSYPSYIN